MTEISSLTSPVLDKKAFSIKDHINNVAVHKRCVTTVALGRNDNFKILRYDMKALVKYSAILTAFSAGTVFTMDKTALLNVALMVVIGFIAGATTVLVSLGETFDSLTNLDVKPLQDLANQINAFVPFCLALYVSLTLSRWWALRVQALGRVFDAFANTCMIVCCELHDKKWATLRNQVAKYGFASVELLIQAARDDDHNPKEDSEHFKKLTGPDFLTDDECRALAKVEDKWHRPMVVWSWIMRICISAMDHHKTPAPRVNAVMGQCINAREGMATINTYLDTQLPFAYVHLITLLVNMQNLVISVKSGITFATAIPRFEIFLMVQQVATLLIVCFIYQALLQISYMIMDPFGDDVLDFPIKAYTNYLAASIDAMLEAQPECPIVAEDGSLHKPKPPKPKSSPKPRVITTEG